uniref:Uncharacterized protein n=1 Tax=Monopterus albus TaxID=43700 RepID=A0A3Q3Q7C1_MONAL
MARNEEKLHGRLNRLWLQKEREEGRLKDVHERRPKLATLNSASAVKKWIPRIKNEIEYYLQQSQLSHYPERKIAEFKLHIEALEKEYKSFTAKLRVLDPLCQHKPWTPRAYCKRRAETQNSPYMGQCVKCYIVNVQMLKWTSQAVCADQDQPLSFDHTRLAVATAAFRGTSVQLKSSPTQSLAMVLQSGLPNLSSAPTGQTFSLHTERVPKKSSDTNTTEERTGHVLGLDCYSSSDEDCGT